MEYTELKNWASENLFESNVRTEYQFMQYLIDLAVKTAKEKGVKLEIMFGDIQRAASTVWIENSIKRVKGQPHIYPKCYSNGELQSC